MKRLGQPILHLQFMTVFLIAYIAYAISYTMLLPYLASLNYTASEKGLLLSGTALIAMIGQFLFGYLCDKYKTVKRMFYLSTMIFILLVYLAYSLTQAAFAFHLLTISLMGGFFRIVVGLLDSWTIERDPVLQKNYGIIRAFGSIGWIIGSPLTVMILNRNGYGSLALWVAILSLVTLIIAFWIDDAHKVAHQDPITLKDLKLLLLKKQYLVLMAILVIINITLYADAYTVVDKILKLGGTPQDISNKWVLQAVCELPLFFFGSWLYRRYSAKTLLMAGIFMFGVRFLLSALATTPFQLVLISSTQLVTFPFILLSSKILVDDESPGHLKSTGQLLGLALYTGLSALVSPLMSGFLVDAVGTDKTLLFFAMLCLIPLGLGFWYRTMKPTYDME